MAPPCVQEKRCSCLKPKSFQGRGIFPHPPHPKFAPFWTSQRIYSHSFSHSSLYFSIGLFIQATTTLQVTMLKPGSTNMGHSQAFTSESSQSVGRTNYYIIAGSVTPTKVSAKALGAPKTIREGFQVKVSQSSSFMLLAASSIWGF